MMVHHPTNKCVVLKDKIQALVNAGVLTLKSEQKKDTANMVTLEFSKTPKVTANMVTLEFGTMPKVTILNGSPPIPKA